MWALATYKVLVAQTLDVHGDEDALDHDATDGLGASAAVFEEGQIAEGVIQLRQAYAGRSLTVSDVAALAREADALAQRYAVEMPITELMHRVLFEGMPPAEAGAALMQRDPKRELEGLF